MFLFNVLIFIFSCALIAFSSKWLIGAISKIAKFLGWKEFIVAFFLMALGASVPNFFVGIMSALNKIPELSFGDIIGGNVIQIALLGGLAALISRKGLSAQSRMVQGSAIFTIGAAILPLILALDSNLSRSDGIILILSFFGYIFWLFHKKERFEKIYDGVSNKIGLSFLLKNIFLFILSSLLLLLAAKGIVQSSIFFADYLNFPLVLVGILIVSLGNSIPDLSFVIHAARKSEDWLILGDLMGGVIITATLVLGIVALIFPFQITDFAAVTIGRIFLIISAVFFLICLRTGEKITKKEALFLLGIYITFVLVEIFTK